MGSSILSSEKVSRDDRKLLRRKFRIRQKISGTAERPRVSVFRSDKHIYAQLIADDKGVTLGSVSTLKFKSADFDEKVSSKSVKAAFLVGFELGKEAKKLGLSSAIFDRNGKRYSGRLKALAEGIRESGIQI